ncbi:mannosyltransferase putative-domain-containing protein [Cladochytrium replicatum]|nr:mannosyltransferase putative-domain-containing protein [Cladochytrium replicatum]
MSTVKNHALAWIIVVLLWSSPTVFIPASEGKSADHGHSQEWFPQLPPAIDTIGDLQHVPQACGTLETKSFSGNHSVWRQYDTSRSVDFDAKRKELQKWMLETMPKLPRLNETMDQVQLALMPTKFRISNGRSDPSVLNQQADMQLQDEILELAVAAEHVRLIKPRQQGIILLLSSNRIVRLPYLRTQIHLLRLYGCDIPIEVWGHLATTPPSVIRTIRKISNRDSLVIFRGADDPRNPWRFKQQKPADDRYLRVVAMMNSQFRRAFVLDASTMPMNNPQSLFDSDLFSRHSAIFWPDIWKTHPHNAVWKCFGIACVDEWELELGALLVDRQKSWNALLLLWHIIESEQDGQGFPDAVIDSRNLIRMSWTGTSTSVHWVPHWPSLAGFVYQPEPAITDTPPNATESAQNQTAPAPPTSRYCGVGTVLHNLDGTALFVHQRWNSIVEWSLNIPVLPVLTHMSKYPSGHQKQVSGWEHTFGYGAKIDEGEMGCMELLPATFPNGTAILPHEAEMDEGFANEIWKVLDLSRASLI